MRSQRLLLPLALIVLLISCSSESPYEPDGEETYELLTVPTEYASIAEAAAEALPGDTLLVLEGIYEEDVILPAGVMLKGVGADRVQILGGLFVEGSDASVRLEKFSIRNELGAGIVLTDCALKLSHCRVDSSLAAGIELEGDGGVRIQYCSIVGNDVGVYIRNVTTAAHYDDIDHIGGQAPKISQCNFYGNGGDAGAAQNLVFQNIAAPDTVGVSDNFWGIVPVDPAIIAQTILDHHDGAPHSNGFADTLNLHASPLILDVP